MLTRQLRLLRLNAHDLDIKTQGFPGERMIEIKNQTDLPTRPRTACDDGMTITEIC
jgi:hypothetical protein